MAFSLTFISCDPMEDVYDELDASGTTTDPRSIVGSAEYTLTDDDYDDLGLTYGSFNSEDEAKTMLADFIASNSAYDYWAKNSSILINYNLYIGSAFSTKDYTLTQADYSLSGSTLLGFQSTATPSTYLPSILTSGITSPSEGMYAAASYYQFTGDAYVVTPTVSLDENFSLGATAGNLTTISTDWTAHANVGSGLVGYATTSLTMSNYPSTNIGGSATISSDGAEDVNKVLPAAITTGTVYYSALVNLSSVGSGTYFLHFMDDSYGYSARVGAKTDGAGKILFGIGATSTPVDYSTTSYDLNTTYLLVASYNTTSGTSNLYVLTAPTSKEPSTPTVTNTGNSGSSIQKIAIRQGGTSGPSATIDGLRVANSWSAIMSNATLADEVIGTKELKQSYYKYSSGAWAVATDAYALTADDYDSMGTSSGQPGKYNNFDSTMSIDTYVTKFLTINYPYALDGDTMKVLYKYYSSTSGSTGTRGNLYTYTDGAWVAYTSTIATSLQFGFDGTNWVPDNTIKYTLVSADYAYMSTALAGNSFFANVSLTSLAKYNDYDYNWSDAQILYSLDVLLDYKDPTAEDGQKYLITYLLYDNGTNDVVRNLIKENGEWVWNE